MGDGWTLTKLEHETVPFLKNLFVSLFLFVRLSVDVGCELLQQISIWEREASRERGFENAI